MRHRAPSTQTHTQATPTNPGDDASLARSVGRGPRRHVASHRRGVCHHWNGTTCALETGGSECPHRSTHWKGFRNTHPRDAFHKYITRVKHELKPKQAPRSSAPHAPKHPLRCVESMTTIFLASTRHHLHRNCHQRPSTRRIPTRACCPPPPARPKLPAIPPPSASEALLVAFVKERQRQQRQLEQAHKQHEAMRQLLTVVNGIVQQQAIKPSAPSLVLRTPPPTSIQLAAQCSTL